MSVQELEPDTPEPEAGRWAKVRQWVLIGLAAAILIPGIAFIIGWFVIDVDTPQQIAAKQGQGVTLMYNDGVTELGKITGKPRTIVGSGDIAQSMRDAAMAAEDPTFLSNRGFDPLGVVRAVAGQLGLVDQSGGSGITQQYIKVATASDAPTITRKFVEIVSAAKMTSVATKDEIITGYLNTIYFGRDAYGVQEAAKAYFGHSAKELTPSESALLAGLIQQPSSGNTLPNEVSVERFKYVQAQLNKNNLMSQADRAGLKFPENIQPFLGSGSGPNQYIKNQVNDELANGDTGGIGAATISAKGYKVVTTIDKGAQDRAIEAAREIMANQPANLRSALVATDPRTGGVLAYYGGERNNERFLDYASRAQPPGSTFKPFALTAALKNNISPNRTYTGLPQVFPGYAPGVEVQNAGTPTCSRCSLWEGIRQSINTVFIDMVTKGDVTPPQIADAAHEAGIPEKFTSDGKTVKTLQGADGVTNAGIALGEYTVTPKDMANAFGSFVNDGKRNDVHFIAKIIDDKGTDMWHFEAKNKPVFDEANAQNNTDIARTVTRAMEAVVPYSGARLANNRPAAAKSGTVQGAEGMAPNENTQAWFVGYTPQVSTAVWVGADDPKSNGPIALKGNFPCRSSNSVEAHDIYGADEPACIWKSFLNGYLAGKPMDRFLPATKFFGGGGNNNGDDTFTNAPRPTSVTLIPPTTTSGGEDPDPSTTNKPCIPGINCPKPPTSKPPTTEPSDPPTRPGPPTFPGGGGGGGGGTPRSNEE
ncbi:penicillin-binding protein [Pseudonocardiaceae bacterium YIM PH 21723]|nr:penicillin-binding protein [Pseudonocardiaceae bacterium YIM PH 21723]